MSDMSSFGQRHDLFHFGVPAATRRPSIGRQGDKSTRNLCRDQLRFDFGNVVYDQVTTGVDYGDGPITENTRVADPLKHFPNAGIPAVVDLRPQQICFLTCAALALHDVFARARAAGSAPKTRLHRVAPAPPDAQNNHT